jgi:hypothetical protein
MPMYDFNLLSNDDVAKDWEEGEDSRKGGCAVDYEEWNMIDLEAISKISDSSSSFVCVGYNNDLVSPVDELARELVDVTFDTAGLREKEIADHCDIVRHDDRSEGFAVDQLAISG